MDFTYYTSTYKDENGKTLMYAVPSNLSPASEEFEDLVAKRVQMFRKANPDMEETAIPVELVTCSDSRFLGVFGEKTVNVLEVNLMLDGIL